MKASNVTATEELKNLKDTEKNLKKSRENAMKDLENSMKKSQKKAAGLRDELTKYLNKRNGLIAEIEAIKKDYSVQKEQLSICLNGLKRLEKEVEVYHLQVIIVTASFLIRCSNVSFFISAVLIIIFNFHLSFVLTN